MPRHTPHETVPETAHEASTAAPGVPRRAVLPEEMTAVKALVFDVFGTVVDWRGGVARQSAQFLRRHAPAVDPYDFADRWRAEYQPAMERVRSGERPFVRLDELHRENLDRVLAGLGTDPDAVAVAERDELNLVWHRLDPWPDVIAGLHSLRERYIIAPLSNANVRLALDMAKRAGLPWDAILGAEVVQSYKPAPETYLRTVDILGLEPSQVAMVAAHNDDLAAARACGLRTVFVPRRTEHGPRQDTDLEAESDWEIVAEGFGELARTLGAGGSGI
ncbi:haloacid dehalogenase type II [Corynebacterium provencense]|uniref:haloacid dehalogenase type II n=1 Tax=Corynebacterium provencense TaxID=1737425 RepID=UPI000A808D52|nr:haloacid dehalogenase type II [Corynebacterium provencense]